MDAAVAGKRKHFDTDENASNRKVISSLTSRQTLISSNWFGSVYSFHRKNAKLKVVFVIMLINPATVEATMWMNKT